MTWRDTRTGERFTEEAKVVVLAGGCTETPRLCLNSALPNPNGWVGRGFTNHFFDWLVGVFPFETGSLKGPGSGGRVDYPGIGGLANAGATWRTAPTPRRGGETEAVAVLPVPGSSGD